MAKRRTGKRGMEFEDADESGPTRTRRPQAERSETMQRRLLDAAVAVLKERGLAGFRTADVIERAEVSKGALLHHYPTKVRLIAEAFARLREASEPAARRFRPTATLDETVSDLIAESHAFFFGESFYVTLDIATSGARAPELRDAIFATVRGPRQRTEENWIERLAGYGISRERAHDAVWLVNSIIRGLAVRVLYIDEDPLPLIRRLERSAAEMAVAYLSKPDDSMGAST
jgi:AcrR family transcriptional regulator